MHERKSFPGSSLTVVVCCSMIRRYIYVYMYVQLYDSIREGGGGGGTEAWVPGLFIVSWLVDTTSEHGFSL
jgi:hypothetical protein